MKKFRLEQKHYLILVVFVVLFGVGLRLVRYFFTRSLWLDEAMISLNIMDRSFFEFFQPLDYDQSAPVGFLFLEKITTLVFGTEEKSLRLIPLLAGIGALPMMYLVSKKLGGWATVLTSLSLAAVTKYMVYYSNEVKQYSLGVFVTLLLFYLAIQVLDGKSGNQRESFRWYFAGGIIAVWFSNAALFVFAGLSFALMIVFIVRREYVDLRSLLFGGMVWAVNVAVVYFAFLRNSQQNGFLYQYWEEGFAPFPPWKNISWYLTLLKNVANEPLGLQTGLRATWIFYVLLAVGVIRLSIKRWEGTLLILGPIAVTFLASMLRIYPFQERLILFLAPLFFLLMGLGLEGAYEVVAKRNKLIGLSVLVGLSILMLSNPIEGAIKGVLNPSNKEDMRQLFTILKKEALPDDTIYLYYNSVPAYLYYERILGPTLGKVVNGGNHRDTVGLYDEEISTFKGAKRFWVVLLNPFFDKNNEIEKSACKNGSLTAKYVDQDDLRLYLFDLSRVGNSDCEIIGAGNTP